MTSEEMEKAVALLAEYARTGVLCIGNDEAELLRRFARTMGEWREKEGNADCYPPIKAVSI